MIIWPHLVPDLTHDAILIDQEGLAVYAHERRAVHIFLFPDAIELGNSSIGIGKQSKGKTVLISKFLMGPDIISADAQHDDTTLLHNAVGITESASLLGTARSVVFAQLDTCENHVLPCKLRHRAIRRCSGEFPYL